MVKNYLEVLTYVGSNAIEPEYYGEMIGLELIMSYSFPFTDSAGPQSKMFSLSCLVIIGLTQM